MRGKTSKLIRKVAKKTVESTRVPMETRYTISRHTNAVELGLCYRQTIKHLKKSLGRGDFTIEDLKLALVE
jgi:hypothetical protein